MPFAETHELKIITIADLIAYRRKNEKLVSESPDRSTSRPSSATSRSTATSPPSSISLWSRS